MMTEEVLERRLVAAVPGRYLVRVPSGAPPWSLLIGFHGYAEAAETFLSRISQASVPDSWLLCSVQALHPFYRRSTGEVVASWMTSLDRKRALRSNVYYVRKVLRRLEAEFSLSETLVFAGFSQGAAMAFRAAVSTTRGSSAVIALGGDIPPELNSGRLRKAGRVLIGRGRRDNWYTEEKLERDVSRLEAAGVDFEICRFDGGHEWGGSFLDRVGGFLVEIQPGECSD